MPAIEHPSPRSILRCCKDWSLQPELPYRNLDDIVRNVSAQFFGALLTTLRGALLFSGRLLAYRGRHDASIFTFSMPPMCPNMCS